ncbi:hypothetical protein FNV43_RR19006 [Rhamnella rubrinervis]|uniref:Zinc knuckle CX2CX4HX4C domain-containing protein n=1 Tax=Rhamnella rubrinervis TaxID=2594499 RepID=A0A8K0E0D4_9ROSA|nr:hypothetical protein FNV43_RR19006 [Rhamnella rubrinervis]
MVIPSLLRLRQPRVVFLSGAGVRWSLASCARLLVHRGTGQASICRLLQLSPTRGTFVSGAKARSCRRFTVIVELQIGDLLLRQAAEARSRSKSVVVELQLLFVTQLIVDRNRVVTHIVTIGWNQFGAVVVCNCWFVVKTMVIGYGLDSGKSQVEKQLVSEGHKTSTEKTGSEIQIEEIKANRIFTGETTIGKNGVVASEHVNHNGFQKPSFASVVSGAPNTFSQSTKSQNVPIRKGKFVSVQVDDDAYQERVALSNFAHFARVLVDIDLSGFVPKKLLLETTDDYIEVDLFFESFPNFCTACHSVSHSVTKCKSVIGKAPSKIGPHDVPPTPIEETDYQQAAVLSNMAHINIEMGIEVQPIASNLDAAPPRPDSNSEVGKNDEPGNDADDIVEDEWPTLQGAGSSNPSKELDGTLYVGQQLNTMVMIPFVSSDACTAAQRNLNLVASHPLVSETTDQNLWNSVKPGRPKKGETGRRL